jgi:hypothetical protein
MIRFCTNAALAVALVAGTFMLPGITSEAQAKSHHRAKVCRHVTLTGKVKRWRCKRGQFCCSAEIWGYYGCGNKTLGCIKPE